MEEAKKEYLHAKTIYQGKLESFAEKMKPYEELYNLGKITLDELVEIEIQMEELMGINEAFENMKKAEEKLLGVAKILFLKIARTEEEKQAVETVFRCPYIHVRERLVGVVLRMSVFGGKYLFLSLKIFGGKK